MVDEKLLEALQKNDENQWYKGQLGLLKYLTSVVHTYSTYQDQDFVTPQLIFDRIKELLETETLKATERLEND